MKKEQEEGELDIKNKKTKKQRNHQDPFNSPSFKYLFLKKFLFHYCFSWQREPQQESSPR